MLPESPFVGLRPFEAHESVLFFGRSHQSVELMMRLHNERFLAVVGTSGSGKSSLVRAGLIPKLEAGFLVEDCDRWMVVKMKPGGEPLSSFAAAIAGMGGETAAPQEVTAFQHQLRQTGVDAVLERLARQKVGAGMNCLLLVDQFEEVFRYGSGPDGGHSTSESAELVDLMLQLAAQHRLPVYVILTMRSDYFGDCDRFFGLPEAMNKGQYLVPRLSREQLREAITGPVRLFGATITSRLQNRLLNDCGNTSDELPVLQHALMLTWRRWRETGGADIDVDAYEAIGTMSDAISRHAEQAMEGMTADDRDCTRRLFQALTETDSANRSIRRPTRLGDLAGICGYSQETIVAIIRRFQADGRSFLYISEGESNLSNAMVDLSHESLIRRWSGLRDWVRHEAESARTYRRLAERAALHREGKASLLREADLKTAREWRDLQEPNQPWASRYDPNLNLALDFLQESEAAEKFERLAEEKRRNAELRRTRIFAAILIVLFAIAVFLYYQARRAEREADRQRDNATKVSQALLARLKSQLDTSDTAQVVAAMDKLIHDNGVELSMVTNWLPAARVAGHEWLANLAGSFDDAYSTGEDLHQTQELNWMMKVRGMLGFEYSRAKGLPPPPSWSDDDKLNRRIYISGGRFMMGSAENHEPFERAPHLVIISPLHIQQHEVTNEEYARFDRTHTYPAGREKYPVAEVDWFDAAAYAVWLGGDLPSEAQWEFVASGPCRSQNCDSGNERGRTYPWGNDPPMAERGNFGPPFGGRAQGLRQVMSYEQGKTPEGVYDMAGNVWEWCRDWFNVYPGWRGKAPVLTAKKDPVTRAIVELPSGMEKVPMRMARGGSIDQPVARGWLRNAYRGKNTPRTKNDVIGFRVVWDASTTRK